MRPWMPAVRQARYVNSHVEQCLLSLHLPWNTRATNRPHTHALSHSLSLPDHIFVWRRILRMTHRFDSVEKIFNIVRYLKLTSELECPLNAYMCEQHKIMKHARSNVKCQHQLLQTNVYLRLRGMDTFAQSSDMQSELNSYPDRGGTGPNG